MRATEAVTGKRNTRGRKGGSSENTVAVGSRSDPLAVLCD